ncbi:MAG: ATP-binding protein [Acidiferrobacter sp.]
MCLFALIDCASYPVFVHRLTVSFRASSPRSVALTQLHIFSLTVVSSREDFHLQDRAHAGRTHPLRPKDRRGCQIFSELLENALTHAKRACYRDARAWVAAQYYQKTDGIRLAVLDNGCEMLRSLESRPRLTRKTHAGAIQIAFEPRVTCNPDLEIHPNETVNQGIGLAVVREIVTQCRGVPLCPLSSICCRCRMIKSAVA